MSYYWFNRQEILQKAKERYSKEKAAEYYLQNKEAIKRKWKNWYKNLSKEKKTRLKISKKQILATDSVLFFLSIRMSEKTLKFDNIRVNKKEFHKFKQPIDLDLLNVNQIVISDKFNHSDDGFKYFIGYKESEIVKPLCITLPQIIGYIKYFENGGKCLL